MSNLFIMPMWARRYIDARLRVRTLSRGKAWTAHPGRPAPRMFREIVAIPRNHYALMKRVAPGVYAYRGMALTPMDARLWSRGVPGIPVVPPSR